MDQSLFLSLILRRYAHRNECIFFKIRSESIAFSQCFQRLFVAHTFKSNL